MRLLSGETLVEYLPVPILDPSDKFRPEKTEELFRNYTESNEYNERVRNTYYHMHTVQNVEFVKEKHEQWCAFSHAELTILEALDQLNCLVDESDPDVNVPNYTHAFQTAQRIRELHPDNDWFHLVGLIHDIGKVMAIWNEPQCSVVGDTFPVGCAFSDEIVFGSKSFADNADYSHPVYSSPLGIYEQNCGLDHVTMSWGHDEYLYRVLRNHSACTLPDEALYMIRYHSFYPWHTSGEYSFLCSDFDIQMLEWVQEFNKFDLYSKADATPDVGQLLPYYQSLIDKYIPGKIKW